MEEERIVIALGGNAITKPDQKGTYEEKLANIRNTARQIIKIIKKDYEVVLTHGNGPQVGALLIQQEAASSQVPPMPLDDCGSQTQGQIGYLIQQSLKNELKAAKLDKPVVSIVTQVVVDQNDQAFENPTKPIGPFFTEAYAKRMMDEKDEEWIEDAGRGWRKVVPSPNPEHIVEIEAIETLVNRGSIVIASGGGGIPVVKDETGDYQGIEAVIDKDRAAKKLAQELSAKTLMILTDVSHVAINYGTPQEEPLETVSVSKMREYLQEGHFKTGSMKPKVEAAIKFVEHGGKKAIITSLQQGYDALAHNQGTVIVRD